jgi:hypothetical protein
VQAQRQVGHFRRDSSAMASRKRDIGREILEGIRELKRREYGRITTVPMKRGSKKAKSIVTAPSNASPMTRGQVFSVELGPDEQVEWVWTHDHERGSFVSGYKIVPLAANPRASADTKYFEVVIVARSPKTDIGLAHEGHLVQKSDGALETRILPGDYTVEFGLGSPTYPLHVTGDVRWTEEEITASRPCPRPIPYVPPPDFDP